MARLLPASPAIPPKSNYRGLATATAASLSQGYFLPFEPMAAPSSELSRLLTCSSRQQGQPRLKASDLWRKTTSYEVSPQYRPEVAAPAGWKMETRNSRRWSEPFSAGEREEREKRLNLQLRIGSITKTTVRNCGGKLSALINAVTGRIRLTRSLKHSRTPLTLGSQLCRDRGGKTVPRRQNAESSPGGIDPEPRKHDRNATQPTRFLPFQTPYGANRLTSVVLE
ncbi:hypothetical protein Bbelb_032810 [Branchiostoma belcheri]|nr:hypothetical protein Bbelb_032810 [Branchiostoma belcheri]